MGSDADCGHLSCTLALCAASLFPSSASAQGLTVRQERNAYTDQGSSRCGAGRSEEDDESEDPMGWIGIGVKVGLASVGRSEIASMRRASVWTRRRWHAVQPRTHVPDPGSNGRPTLDSDQPRRRRLRVGRGALLSFSSYKATGIYTGPTINLHLADPLYFGFGFGFKGAILRADELDFGIDLGGRIPFTAPLLRGQQSRVDRRGWHRLHGDGPEPETEALRDASFGRLGVLFHARQ